MFFQVWAARYKPLAIFANDVPLVFASSREILTLREGRMD